MTTFDMQVYPPIPTFTEQQQMAITKVDEITSMRILGGFDYQPPREVLPTGVFSEEEDVPTFHFSTTNSDQSNFGDASSLYLSNLLLNNTAYTQNWRGWIDGNAYTLTFTLSTFADFGVAYAAHKNTTLATGWAWKADILAATTIAEIKTIFTNYGITEAEILAINCVLFDEADEE